MDVLRTGPLYPAMLDWETELASRVRDRRGVGLAVLSIESGGVDALWLVDEGGRSHLTRQTWRGETERLRLPRRVGAYVVSFFERVAGSIESSDELVLDGVGLLVVVRDDHGIRVISASDPDLATELGRVAYAHVEWLRRASRARIWLASAIGAAPIAM